MAVATATAIRLMPFPLLRADGASLDLGRRNGRPASVGCGQNMNWLGSGLVVLGPPHIRVVVDVGDVPLIRMPHVALGAGETGPRVGSGSRVVAPPTDG